MTQYGSSAHRRTVLQGLTATGTLALAGTAVADEKKRGDEVDDGQSNSSSVLTPVYELFNREVSDHLYTTDPAEREQSVQNGYEDLGAAWYVFNQQVAGTTPLYRLYKEDGVYDHFYTTSRAERDRSHRQNGYEKEGIEGYVFEERSPALEPLYRLYKQGSDHAYTISRERWAKGPKAGYLQEEIIGYALR